MISSRAMISIKRLPDTFDECQKKGYLKLRSEVDLDRAASLFSSALRGLKRSKKVGETIEQDIEDHAFIFVEQYDILRKLIDAHLLFDRVQADNHQCSNAYLCVKYPELEMDWEILESMRLLRNQANYEGKSIDAKIWKEFKVKFDIYIMSISEKVQKNLSINTD